MALRVTETMCASRSAGNIDAGSRWQYLAVAILAFSLGARTERWWLAGLGIVLSVGALHPRLLIPNEDAAAPKA